MELNKKQYIYPIQGLLNHELNLVGLMEEPSQNASSTIPFQNLFLISGLVNGLNKAWMYISTLILIVAGYILFQFIAFFPLLNRLFDKGYSRAQVESNPNLLFDYKALDLDKNIVLSLELLMFVFAFLGFFAGLRFFHQKPLASVMTGYQRFRFKRFGFSFLIWSLLLILFLLVNIYLYPGEFEFKPDLTGLLLSTLVMLLLMPIQTGLEELIFRGYLIQGFALLFRNGWIPLILTSLIFGMAHMSNPEVKRYGWEIMLLYYVSFALFMGALTLVDEGLELAFGIHFANNMISSILISSPNSVIKTYSLFEVKTEDPHTEMLAWTLMAILSFFIFARKYRWKNYHLILK